MTKDGQVKFMLAARIFVLQIFISVIASACALDLRGGEWRHVDVVASATSLQMPEVPTKLVSFETDEGTNLNVDISPDGRTLTFDLLGDIYLLPSTGGEAVSLTTGHAWDQAPRFSPDGTSVYFVSDRKSYKNIWRVSLTDQSVGQVTKSESNIMGTPNWSQQGAHLVAAQADAQSGVETALQLIDSATGQIVPLENMDGPWIDMDTFERHRDPIKIFSGVQSANGEVYVAEAKPDVDYSKARVRIYKIDPETRDRNLITPADAPYNEFKPQLSHDGNLLSYFRQYPDRRAELRVLHLDTGQDRALLQLIDADDASYYASHELWPNYAFIPDDRHIVFWQAGKIHRVRLVDGASEIIPFHVKVEREVWSRVEPSVQKIDDIGEAKIIRWPSLSDDGETLFFAAIGYIWLMDMETGDLRRLTTGTDFEYMPAPSPDGQSVAYIGFRQLKDGYGPARVVIAGIDGSSSQDILTARDGMYLLPNWSPDGSKIAVIREAPKVGDGGTQIETFFGWTDAEKGAFQEVALAPASGSRANLYVYARWVGFNPTSDDLVFSYPRSQTETELATANLDGSDLQILAIGGESVGGMVPAPDLKHLALTDKRGGVWIKPFTAGETPVQISASSGGARRVSESGGYYIDWTEATQFTFGFGQNFYRYDVALDSVQVRPIKLAIKQPVAAQPIAFKGARLITLSGESGAGRVIESGIIVMDGQRISAIGSQDRVAPPASALVIDVTGKTIMPGLLDTHYHRIGGSSGPASGLSAFKFPNSDFEDTTAIAYGVTSAWEPAGPVSDGSPATVDLQVAGRIAGPRWSHAAAASVGYPYDQLTTYGSALAAVRQHRVLGVDTLKEYNAPTRTQRQWLAVAAYEQGVGIVSHIDHFDGMMTRVVDGYTGGDHPYVPAPLFKDVKELLNQTGYIWTPNVIITSGTVGTASGDKASFYWHDVHKKRPDELKKLESITGGSRELSEPTMPYELHRVARVAKAAAGAAKHGAKIGISAHSMPGSNLHQEMWYLWKSGMPIEGVIRAATMVNAEKLGLQEEVGSLEVGKIADFLVLEENPLDDILNTLSLKYTVQGGVIYNSTTAKRADLTSISDTEAAVLH